MLLTHAPLLPAGGLRAAAAMQRMSYVQILQVLMNQQELTCMPDEVLVTSNADMAMIAI